MSDKTCGECRYLESIEPMGLCKTTGKPLCLSKLPACGKFEQKVITNGDVIRQGGDYALAHFKSEQRCDVCAYAAPLDHAPACQRPDGKVCFDGMLAWLNAPAESEVNNG